VYRSWTKVRRAVVAVEIDEWVTQRERLRHTHQRVVNGRVTVWVITRHGVTSNACTLYEWTVGAETLLLHVPNNAAVHGLKSVTHVGQCARHDDRHGVVEERAFHFIVQRNRLDLIEQVRVVTH
jgi:hypothetical protein